VKLSVVIPAHNEEESIATTTQTLVRHLDSAAIEFELIIVNDSSSDNTVPIVQGLQQPNDRIRLVHNTPPNGFGLAVRKGLESVVGSAVVIVMADGSDDPADVVKYFLKLQEGFDCVFGSRFTRDSKIADYPYLKLIINRMVNLFIRILFGFRYNDTTNAFKCYRSEVIRGLHPLLSHHFNLTVELPLKAIIRGYTYSVVPINWYGRTHGVSKLKLKEMGSRYLFIILYVWLEKMLSRGDYQRTSESSD